MKSFIITVDTEGDDLWHWKPGQDITTENTKYIPRFQELCEKYGFKPVYLTNYEMAMDDRWVAYSAEKARAGQCEIGMHLHAWNTPPEYSLENRFGGNPYITEYPAEVIEQKVATMMDLLQRRYEMPILSHRSGRWATNEEYFRILAQNGIQIDCSVTPELDLSGISGCSVNCGNDYCQAPKTPYRVCPDILEVPMTTRQVHHLGGCSARNRLRNFLLGEATWLRPIRLSTEPMKRLTNWVIKEGNCDYLEFMIHSSELMPGGSIFFKNEEAVEQLYAVMESYFAYVQQLGYCGSTLQEYAYMRENENV